MNTPLYRTIQVSDPPPTIVNYLEFQDAFNYFNDRLFIPVLKEGAVPQCIIYMTRRNRTHGYYIHHKHYDSVSGESFSELGLNPQDFVTRSPEQILSTLVHEMAHAWQYCYGTPSPNAAYHNKEWAEIMDSLGLPPSSDGTPEGKKTGQSMTHLIDPTGAFAVEASVLLEWGWQPPYIDRPVEKKKRQNLKPKYTCPKCQAQVWGKPGLALSCINCAQEPLEQEEIEEDDGA